MALAALASSEDSSSLPCGLAWFAYSTFFEGAFQFFACSQSRFSDVLTRHPCRFIKPLPSRAENAPLWRGCRKSGRYGTPAAKQPKRQLEAVPERDSEIGSGFSQPIASIVQ
jgi:hypothetical protein